MHIDPTTDRGRAGLAALLAKPRDALVAFDYDGTLAPIVDDPGRAKPSPDVVEALTALSQRVALVAIVTGRPAQQAVDLAGLDSAPGLERFVVLGHYGVERWDASTGSIQSIDPPEGLALVRSRLPELLATMDLAAAEVEDKRLSVAVHVRRHREPTAAFARMEQPLRDLAAEAGLTAEPGRHVLELRPAGMDKGQALRRLVDEVNAGAVTFAGDDLGDLAAFDEVDRLRLAGHPGLLICSGSVEVPVVAERADLVVDGPDGIAHMLSELVLAVSA
jgi:trehalose 6-phosphate phosphatase